MQHFNTIIGNNIQVAQTILESGEVIGIPTETVYGLAGNALNEDVALKIFSVKNRPHFDPLIVHTHSVSEIEKYVTEIPDKARLLMRSFMPGALTLLLKKKSLIPDIITSGLDTVAIRVPAHPLTLKLLKELPFPLAAPSANPFGYISPTTAAHVYNQLQGKIPYILDGGATTVGVESTIVGFEGDDIIVYRLGGLALEEIERVTGKIKVNINTASNPKTPGMLKSHYAPSVPLLFDDPELLGLAKTENKTIGTICFNTLVTGLNHSTQILLSPAGDLNEAAKNLFAAMRKLDTSGLDIIYAVKFPDEGLGKAINDRLKRASAK